MSGFVVVHYAAVDVVVVVVKRLVPHFLTRSLAKSRLRRIPLYSYS